MQRRTTGIAIVVGIVVVLVAGSIVYWIGEGRPGTPAEFRQRVAESGLDVEWTNNGPRGGDGTVDTDCGTAAVTVRELDGDLWLTVADRQTPLDDEAIAALERCDG